MTNKEAARNASAAVAGILDRTPEGATITDLMEIAYIAGMTAGIEHSLGVIRDDDPSRKVRLVV